jgi:hypothetical protein
MSAKVTATTKACRERQQRLESDRGRSLCRQSNAHPALDEAREEVSAIAAAATTAPSRQGSPISAAARGVVSSVQNDAADGLGRPEPWASVSESRAAIERAVQRVAEQALGEDRGPVRDREKKEELKDQEGLH